MTSAIDKALAFCRRQLKSANESVSFAVRHNEEVTDRQWRSLLDTEGMWAVIKNAVERVASEEKKEQTENDENIGGVMSASNLGIYCRTCSAETGQWDMGTHESLIQYVKVFRYLNENKFSLIRITPLGEIGEDLRFGDELASFLDDHAGHDICIRGRDHLYQPVSYEI